MGGGDEITKLHEAQIGKWFKVVRVFLNIITDRKVEMMKAKRRVVFMLEGVRNASLKYTVGKKEKKKKKRKKKKLEPGDQVTWRFDGVGDEEPIKWWSGRVLELLENRYARVDIKEWKPGFSFLQESEVKFNPKMRVQKGQITQSMPVGSWTKL